MMTIESLLFFILILVLTFSQAWLLLRFNREWMRKETEHSALILKSLDADLRREGFKTMLPLRIQAGERMVLFLERLQPQQLINRYFQEGGTQAGVFSQVMLRGIREEFEYNLSQQLFLSDTAWQLTKAANEEVIQLIHLCKNTLDDDSPAHLLATELLQHEPGLIGKAIGQIKNDLDKLTL